MRVVIHSLEERTLPLETPLHAPERLATAAGDLALLADGTTFQFLAFLTFVPSAVRGNHLHQRRSEWLYVIDGLVQARFYDTVERTFWEVDVSGGTLIQMPPGCAHAYYARKKTQAIEFANMAYDATETLAYLLYP